MPITQAQTLHRSPLVLETDSGELHGSLMVPEARQAIPVALLIAGSGPTDRDGNNPAGRNDSLKKLAEALAGGGVASLRYDKRGIAASTAAGPDERLLSIEGYAADAAAWSRRLKDDPRFSRVILIGHSEGALVASLASEAAHADALVLIAGSGRPLDRLLDEQLRQRLPAPLLKESRAILAALSAGHDYPVVSDELQVLFRPSVQPFLRSLMRHPPAEALASTHAPALIVQGTHDAQVGTADAHALQTARPDAQLLIIRGMNHVLRIAPQPFDAQRYTYHSPELPLARQLTQGILAFIHKMAPPTVAVGSADNGI